MKAYYCISYIREITLKADFGSEENVIPGILLKIGLYFTKEKEHVVLYYN